MSKVCDHYSKVEKEKWQEYKSVIEGGGLRLNL